MVIRPGTLSGHRSRRFALWFFLMHLSLTVAMLHWVAPLFSVMREPPPAPNLGTQAVALFAKLLALPLLLPLSAGEAVDLIRPDLVYVLLNSFCATGIAVAGYALLRRRRADIRVSSISM